MKTSFKVVLTAASALGMAVSIVSPASAADVASTAIVSESSDVSIQSRSVLSVPAEVQQMENWCWATTGSTISNYLGVRSANQRDFCRAGLNIRGRYCPDRTGQMYNVQRGFRHYGVDPGRATRVLSFRAVQNNIDSNSPIPAGFYWSAGGGHMITITGYDSRENAIKINNSYRSHRRQMWIDYRTFVSNRQFRWAESIAGVGGGREATEAQTQEVAAADVTRSAVEAAAPVAAEAATAAAKSDSANGLLNLVFNDAGVSTRSVEATSMSAGVQTYTLNPEFVKGNSNNPAQAHTVAVVATRGSEKATVMVDSVNGENVAVAAGPGTEEVDYTSKATNGVVFTEPQTGAWFEVAGDFVRPLNDAAMRVTMGATMPVNMYQKSVQSRFADKMAGSDYQAQGNYGGLNH